MLLKTANFIVKPFVIVTTLCLPAFALAQPMGFYVGGGFGQYDFSFEDDDIDFDFNDNQSVSKLFAGMQFTPALGAEAQILAFSEAHEDELDADVQGFSLAAVANAPISERFGIFGKLGLLQWEADYDGQITGDGGTVAIDDSADGTDFFYGIGAKFGLTDQLYVRLEYDRYEIDADVDPELDIASLALQYTF